MDLATTRKVMDLSKVKHFIMDECDRLLAEVDMRKDVQTVFLATPVEKQVMMYSATLDDNVRPICRKFCQDPMRSSSTTTPAKAARSVQYYVKLTRRRRLAS